MVQYIQIVVLFVLLLGSCQSKQPIAQYNAVSTTDEPNKEAFSPEVDKPTNPNLKYSLSKCARQYELTELSTKLVQQLQYDVWLHALLKEGFHNVEKDRKLELPAKQSAIELCACAMVNLFSEKELLEIKQLANSSAYQKLGNVGELRSSFISYIFPEYLSKEDKDYLLKQFQKESINKLIGSYPEMLKVAFQQEYPILYKYTPQ